MAAAQAAEDDDDNGEAAKPATNEFQQLLSALSPDGSATKPGMDPAMVMLMKMQQDQAAQARSDRDAFWTKVMAIFGVVTPLLVPLIEKLFSKKETDPILLKLLETMSSGKQSQEFFQMMMAMQSKSAEMQSEAMTRTMASVDAMKEKAFERTTEMMEEKLARMGERDDEETGKGGTAELVREIRLAAQAGIAALPQLTGATKQPTPPTTAQLQETATPPMLQPSQVPRLPLKLPPTLIALQVMRQMHTGEIPKERHRSLTGKIAGTIAEDPALAALIVDDNLAGLLAHVSPLIRAPGQEQLAEWAAKPDTLASFETYIREKIQPVLRMLAESNPPKAPEPIPGPGASPETAPPTSTVQGQGT